MTEMQYSFSMGLTGLICGCIVAYGLIISFLGK